MKESDFIAKGFHKLENEVVNPPKIKWGHIFNGEMPGADGEYWDDAHRIKYLQKLASSMNHAAMLIQGERDKLLAVCLQKDKQVASMTQSVEQNNMMLQTEVTKMNENKQAYHATIARLNKEVKELRANGNNNRLADEGHKCTAS